MAGLTGDIEQFLLKMLNNTDDGILEIGRNDLAVRFDCAPSQINYVLSTRFTPYKGYYIESRRGGSGYIKIIRLERDRYENLQGMIDEYLQTEITLDKARSLISALKDAEVISEREELLMIHALAGNALKNIALEDRNLVRASILKNMLLVFLR